MNLLDLSVKVKVDDQASGQIESVAGGIKGKLASAAQEGIGRLGGAAATAVGAVTKVAVAGVGAAAAGAAALGKAALEGYADFEQLSGGISKLFGADSQAVMDYASQAFKTAGMSANEYMETVTGFSASLIQGLGGDTQLAAELADVAIRDMSDNANTFGTDMASVQAAYQGFARQNFTLLDNLRLGYSGSASEMARLINDSGILAGQMEVTADNLSEVSFDQIIQAIHEVQTQQGIMGTTANEAAGTVSGSIATMQAAWANFTTAIGGGGDLTATADALVESIEQVVANVMPVVERIAQGIATAVPRVLPGILKVVTDLVSQVAAMLPQVMPPLVTALVDALDAVVGALPQILPSLVDGVVQIVVAIAGMMPELMPALIDASVALFMALVEAVPQIVPPLLEGVWGAIMAAVGKVGEAVAPMLAAGGQVLQGLLTGVTQGFQAVLDFFAGIPARIVGALGDVGSMLLGAGQSIIDGFLSGITGAFGGVADFVSGIGPWIAQNKGPADYDARLLVGAGGLIMGGLAKGLESGMGGVRAAVAEANGIIAGGITARPRASLAAAGAFGGAGVINVYVDGNALHTDARLREFGIAFVEELERQARA